MLCYYIDIHLIDGEILRQIRQIDHPRVNQLINTNIEGIGLEHMGYFKGAVQNLCPHQFLVFFQWMSGKMLVAQLC